MTSSKIAPFRKYSKLYSGQKKQALRTWVFSEKEIEETEQRLRALIESGLRTGDPYETTQFLRGRLFTLIDCLLTHTYKNKFEQNLSVSLFILFLDYFVQYLRQAKELFEKYYEGLSNINLFLTDDSVALSMAWPELIFTVSRIFGLDPRTRNIRTLNYWPKEYEPTSEIITKGNNNLLTLYVLNYFAKLDGFRTILSLLNEQE